MLKSFLIIYVDNVILGVYTVYVRYTQMED